MSMIVPSSTRETRVRFEFGGLFNIAPGANAFLDGDPIEEDHFLGHGETLEFIKLLGRKGMGRVWTREEFCEVFKIGGADLDAMISKGLPVHQMGDGSVRLPASWTRSHALA